MLPYSSDSCLASLFMVVTEPRMDEKDEDIYLHHSVLRRSSHEVKILDFPQINIMVAISIM